MRKVKFPLELDASTFATPDLQQRLAPVSHRCKAVAKEREERAKVRRRAKAHGTEQHAPSDAPSDAPRQEGSALSDDEERALRAKEHDEVEALIDPELRSDTGCNPSGLYELVGIVTHKGAAADAGHYISWVRKENESRDPLADLPSNEWYKFDDDKASVVDADKISTLYGGGEDSVAYILLYRARALP